MGKRSFIGEIEKPNWKCFTPSMIISPGLLEHLQKKKKSSFPDQDAPLCFLINFRSVRHFRNDDVQALACAGKGEGICNSVNT